MPLAAGVRFGPYEILAPLGAGGMGEVYKARDTRLDRTVAIKVLPSHIASREDLRARFEREARAVSSLNHPHICVLYDIGQQDGIDFMVLEHLEGGTLFDRLQRGPLPLDQALKYAMQIADAVDRAHRSGVVHRDLKPGNIMLTRDGVKVLDFGLAKTAPKTAADGATMTMALTSEGTVLGTPQYMSPEQISGSEADARSDIFAFGCVLYEMVTGKRAFDGKTKASVIGAILSAEPPPMSTLQPVTPPELEQIVQRCLAKDPEERSHCLRDVLLELRSIRPVSQATRDEPRGKHPRLPWAVAAILAAAAGLFAFLWLRVPAPEGRAIQFTLDPPEGTVYTNPNGGTAVSPDGKYLVFAAGQQSNPILWLRALDSLAARPLRGSESGNFPFWSPDSKSVAYIAGGKLKRSDIAGGTPQVLCDASGLASGTWGIDNTVLFAGPAGIMRVPASGGVPQQVTKWDTSRKESGHNLPQFLPDGKRFLYFAGSSDPNIEGVYAASLDDPNQRRRILATDRKAQYLPPRAGRSGFLLWMRDQTLLAQPFDHNALSLAGDAMPLIEEVATSRVSLRAGFWASDSGVLVYRRDFEGDQSRPVWMSREGKELSETSPEGTYGPFRLSPDGSRLAFSLGGDAYDVWVLEFARAIRTRLTFDSGNDHAPVWSADGNYIVFASDRTGGQQLYRKRFDGSGPEQQLTTGPRAKTPRDWSPDGRWLLYNEFDGAIWASPITGQGKPIAVVASVAGLRTPEARFSPDGQWIAYVSAESGRSEVYVQQFPEPSGRWQVSNQGGAFVRWRADGKELFYMQGQAASGSQMMAATVRIAGGKFESDSPRKLFDLPPSGRFVYATAPYDVTPDGQRFLVLKWTVGAGVPPLTVVSDWHALLKP